MPAPTKLFGGWLQQCHRKTSSVPALSRSSSFSIYRSIHSSTRPSFLPSATTSASYSTADQHQQSFPLQHSTLLSSSSSQPLQHRCTAACSHHEPPSLIPSSSSSSSPAAATRTVMSAIDSLPSLPTSTPLSLLFPLSLPLSAPSAVPFADLPLECAVPKRKPSPRAQRHRRAGQRAVHARRVHQQYRICLNCGSPVKPHYLCNRCRTVVGRF